MLLYLLLQLFVAVLASVVQADDRPADPLWPEVFHIVAHQTKTNDKAVVDLYYDYPRGGNLNLIRYSMQLVERLPITFLSIMMVKTTSIYEVSRLINLSLMQWSPIKGLSKAKRMDLFGTWRGQMALATTTIPRLKLARSVIALDYTYTVLLQTLLDAITALIIRAFNCTACNR
jgi:hypothetical protein